MYSYYRDKMSVSNHKIGLNANENKNYEFIKINSNMQYGLKKSEFMILIGIQ